MGLAAHTMGLAALTIGLAACTPSGIPWSGISGYGTSWTSVARSYSHDGHCKIKQGPGPNIYGPNDHHIVGQVR
jgi:hypothetical protein